MRTPAQRTASGANGARSRGPKAPAGKLRSTTPSSRRSRLETAPTWRLCRLRVIERKTLDLELAAQSSPDDLECLLHACGSLAGGVASGHKKNSGKSPSSNTPRAGRHTRRSLYPCASQHTSASPGLPPAAAQEEPKKNPRRTREEPKKDPGRTRQDPASGHTPRWSCGEAGMRGEAGRSPGGPSPTKAEPPHAPSTFRVILNLKAGYEN
jgi:hypothetical protein